MMTTDDAFTAARRLGIGGSDWGGILYVPPWGCARKVFYDKVEPDGALPREETGPMKRGHALEDLVAKEYSGLYARKVRRIGRFRRPDWLPAWWIGNPDRGIVDKYRGPGVLEAKTVNGRRWQSIGDEPPQPWVLQLMHYLALTSRKWGAIAALNVDTWEMKTWEVKESTLLQSTMLERGRQFWKTVEENSPPDRIPPENASKACTNCRYRLVCYQGLDELLGATGEAVVPEDSVPDEAKELVKTYLQLNETSKEIKARMDELKAKIKAIWPEGSVHVEGESWKLSLSRGVRRTFDARAFKQANPDVAKQYERDQVVEALRVTQKK